MRIAIASGKGGTGKTTVAVSLFLAVAGTPPATGPGLRPVYRPADLLYLDCDVEEPNAAIFLRPEFEGEEEVGILVPEVDPERCTACGRCAEVCAYHAIAVLGQKVLVFPQLCHGCGSCAYNCPTGAIEERLHPTGSLAWGRVPGFEGARFAQGELKVGEAMATPVIRQLKDRMAAPAATSKVVLLDASPGNACPVVETMRGADGVLLVTEPTPFGLHDLRIAVQLARDELKLPVGVIINRDGVGDQSVSEFCAAHSVPILLRIPLDRRIAEAYAEGIPLITALPAYRAAFLELYAGLQTLAAGRQVL
jgi:MinD superfamily P-loop ATPase